MFYYVVVIMLSTAVAFGVFHSCCAAHFQLVFEREAAEKPVVKKGKDSLLSCDNQNKVDNVTNKDKVRKKAGGCWSDQNRKKTH